MMTQCSVTHQFNALLFRVAMQINILALNQHTVACSLLQGLEDHPTTGLFYGLALKNKVYRTSSLLKQKHQ